MYYTNTDKYTATGSIFDHIGNTFLHII